MITQVIDGKTYTGRDLLDIAIKVQDDREDARRREGRLKRRPFRGQKCSERSF